MTNKPKPSEIRKCQGFQTQLSVIDRCIITPLQLMPAHRPEEIVSPYDVRCRGLWDTGAQNSLIKDSLAKELGLKWIGEEEIMGVGGPCTANKYLTGLILPNNVILPCIEVTGFPGTDKIEMLIGMDIILYGDFLVSREKDTIHFSFQFPSYGGFYLKDIHDLTMHNGSRSKMVDQIFHPLSPIKRIQSTKVGRNDPCPCGSSLKYKKCCGKTK